jgi:hypothetical protein
MTDSHSWPLSILGFEDLAEAGAYSEVQIYDEADIQEIVTYAAEVSDKRFPWNVVLLWAELLTARDRRNCRDRPPRSHR